MDFNLTKYWLNGHVILPYVALAIGCLILQRERTKATYVMLACGILWPTLFITSLIWHMFHPIPVEEILAEMQSPSLFSIIFDLAIMALQITWGVALIFHSRQSCTLVNQIAEFEQSISSHHTSDE